MGNVLYQTPSAPRGGSTPPAKYLGNKHICSFCTLLGTELLCSIHQTSSQEGTGGGLGRKERRGPGGKVGRKKTPILPQHRASDYALL
jgi:hypothetical protein